MTALVHTPYHMTDLKQLKEFIRCALLFVSYS